MSSMTDLTERLREVPKGQGHSFPSTGPNGEPCRTVVPYGNMMHLAADALETITQENARLREAGWQDIESAPKEHLARFLAYAEPRSDTEQVVFEVTRYDDKWGNHIRLNEGYGSSTERDILKRLTHWMPLPPAPARKALGGGDEQ